VTISIIQAGSGDIRPLLLVYLLAKGSEQDLIDAMGPSAAIAADTGPDQNYYGTVPSLDKAIADVASQTGASAFAPVLVAGFSAGGFAVKRILSLGARPDAVLLADATYGTDLKDWTDYATLARAGKAVMEISYSSYTGQEPSRPSVWRNLQNITGMDLPLGAAASPRPTGALLMSTPTTLSDGNLTVHGYPDGDHHAQGATVLPTVLLPEAMRALTSSMPTAKGGMGKGLVVAGAGLALLLALANRK